MACSWPYCNEVKRRINQVFSSSLIASPTTRARVRCRECGATFRRSWAITMHVRVHTKVRIRRGIVRVCNNVRETAPSFFDYQEVVFLTNLHENS